MRRIQGVDKETVSYSSARGASDRYSSAAAAGDAASAVRFAQGIRAGCTITSPYHPFAEHAGVGDDVANTRKPRLQPWGTPTVR